MRGPEQLLGPSAVTGRGFSLKQSQRKLNQTVPWLWIIPAGEGYAFTVDVCSQ